MKIQTCTSLFLRSTCKPYDEFYLAAEAAVDAPDLAQHYFVDDSRTNIEAAQRLGWEHCGMYGVLIHSVYFDETGTAPNSIAHLRELVPLWSSLFRR